MIDARSTPTTYTFLEATTKRSKRPQRDCGAARTRVQVRRSRLDALSEKEEVDLSSAEEKHEPDAYEPEPPGRVGDRDDRAREFPARLLKTAEELGDVCHPIGVPPGQATIAAADLEA